MCGLKPSKKLPGLAFICYSFNDIFTDISTVLFFTITISRNIDNKIVTMIITLLYLFFKRTYIKSVHVRLYNTNKKYVSELQKN